MTKVTNLHIYFITLRRYNIIQLCYTWPDMRNRKELTLNNQNLIRLFLITAYIIMHSPLFLRFLSKRGPEEYTVYPLITMIGALFILMLEYTEFFVWKYEAPKKIRYVLFFLQILPFAALLISRSTDLYAYIFGPLVIFYGAFLFNKGKREAVFIIILCISFLIPFYATMPAHFREPPSEAFKIFIGIIRTGKVLFFYIMGILFVEEKKSTIRRKQLMEELEESNRKITEYASRIADTVAAEERTRLARDIHDSIGHYLTATNIQLAKAKAFFSIDPDASLKAIEDAQKASKEAMDDVRASVSSLKSSDNFSFKDGLVTIIKRIEDCGIQITENISGSEAGCSYAVSLALFRVIQEALTNAVKHSQCSEVNISVNFENSRASAVIKDNGKGFETESVPGTSSGLAGIRKRIELVRGEVKITSAEGKGTVITASAPFDPVSTS